MKRFLLCLLLCLGFSFGANAQMVSYSTSTRVYKAFEPKTIAGGVIASLGQNAAVGGSLRYLPFKHLYLRADLIAGYNIYGEGFASDLDVFCGARFKRFYFGGSIGSMYVPDSSIHYSDNWVDASIGPRVGILIGGKGSCDLSVGFRYSVFDGYPTDIGLRFAYYF